MSDASLREFKLADIGEGLVEARVVEVLVAVGDSVERFQNVLEVETDKSVVELSSPWAGTVKAIHAVVDEYVEVGDTLLEIEVSSDA